MERLIQILLLSTPAATAGPLAAGVEGLVLGLDEAGTLWTGKLGRNRWGVVSSLDRGGRSGAG